MRVNYINLVVGLVVKHFIVLSIVSMCIAVIYEEVYLFLIVRFHKQACFDLLRLKFEIICKLSFLFAVCIDCK